MMATFMAVMVPRAVGQRRPDQRGAGHRVLGGAADRRRSLRVRNVGEISLEAVEFTYPGASEPVLRDITFRRQSPARRRRSSARPAPARPPCCRSSRGCSTPRRGAVRVDDVDVRRLRPGRACGTGSAWCRRSRSCSPERSRPTCATATRTRPTSELWAALTIAQARDFVAAMPEGLDSPDHPGRFERVRWPTAATGDRPRTRRGPAHLPVRRFLLRAGPGHRRAAARRAAPDHPGRDGDHRRAAGVDHRRRRPDHRAGGRAASSGSGRHDELLETCPTFVEIVESQLARRCRHDETEAPSRPPRNGRSSRRRRWPSRWRRSVRRRHRACPPRSR